MRKSVAERAEAKLAELRAEYAEAMAPFMAIEQAGDEEQARQILRDSNPKALPPTSFWLRAAADVYEEEQS